MGAIYEIFIDVLAVNNFFMDLAAFIAINLFLKRRIRAYRLLAGAAFGTVGNCVTFAVCRNMAAYFLIVHFILNPVLLFFCFREKNRRDFLADLCVGYFTFLIAGGAMEWLYAGGNGFLSYWIAVGVAVLLVIAVVIWARRYFKKCICYIDVTICQGEKCLSLRALSDSGNLLCDPYTGKAVNMIDRQVYEAAYGPPQGVRMIPYESLGCKHGLLEAVTIEKLNYAYNHCEENIQQAVLGLVDHALFEKKPYQMIMNPQENSAGGKYEKDR